MDSHVHLTQSLNTVNMFIMARVDHHLTLRWEDNVILGAVPKLYNNYDVGTSHFLPWLCQRCVWSMWHTFTKHVLFLLIPFSYSWTGRNPPWPPSTSPLSPTHPSPCSPRLPEPSSHIIVSDYNVSHWVSLVVSRLHPSLPLLPVCSRTPVVVVRPVIGELFDYNLCSELRVPCIHLTRA